VLWTICSSEEQKISVGKKLGSVAKLVPKARWEIINWSLCFVLLWNSIAYIEGGTQAEGSREEGLRRIVGRKRDEVTREWWRLHGKELYGLCFSPNIIRVIKSGKQIVRTCSTWGERRGAYRSLVGRPEGRNHLKDLGVDGRLVLKWIFDKLDGAWTGSI
jgi:hypothetical protein